MRKIDKQIISTRYLEKVWTNDGLACNDHKLSYVLFSYCLIFRRECRESFPLIPRIRFKQSPSLPNNIHKPWHRFTSGLYTCHMYHRVRNIEYWKHCASEKMDAVPRTSNLLIIKSFRDRVTGP